MHKVEVHCKIKLNGTVRDERFEARVDITTLQKASFEDKRKELNPWAKLFFPEAEWVEITQMRKL